MYYFLFTYNQDISVIIKNCLVDYFLLYEWN
jgi:hypothetical protein